MEKKQYVKPETSVCRMEAQMMIARSLRLGEGEADPDIEVLSNEDSFIDIWGHEY